MCKYNIQSESRPAVRMSEGKYILASVKNNNHYSYWEYKFNDDFDYNNQKLGLVEDEAIDAITKRGRENKIWFQEFNTHLLSS